jgi:hypothetical protein
MPGSEIAIRIQRREEIDDVLVQVRARTRVEGIDDVALMVQLGLCPAPFIADPLATEAYRLFAITESGGPWPWTGGYYDQPAIFIDCVEVIRDERARIAAEMRVAGG